MSNEQDFPQALVGQRAREMREVWRAQPVTFGRATSWEAVARLSLHREAEACEPLVEALEYAARDHRYHNWLDTPLNAALAAHRARYAPEPPKPTLAEAVEAMLSGRFSDAAALEAVREALERAKASDTSVARERAK